MNSTTHADAPDIDAARSELAKLQVQLRTGGRIFYAVIATLIALSLAFAQLSAPSSPSTWILVAVFALLAVTSFLGFHPDLPRRWGGRATHERIIFLKGVIQAAGRGRR